VPERCTCGAQLPPDALFCHRCGKPQRELLEPDPEPEVELAPPPIPVVAAPAAAPIGFRNAQVVRIALLAGALSILVCGVGGQIAPALSPLWMILSGMLSAFIYKLRTGQRLSAIGGARLGWISGIFGFVIVAIMLGLLAWAILHDPSAMQSVRDQFAKAGRTGADFDSFVEALRQPSNVMAMLALSFLLFTVLSAFGGAIGARLLDRD
jgi:hypothetical protein